MSLFQNEMSIITSVEKIENSNNTGYLIKTDNEGVIKILVLNTKTFCKTCGVYALKNDVILEEKLQQLVGKRIKMIDVVFANNNFLNPEGLRNISITTKNDKIPVVFCLYKEHEGKRPPHSYGFNVEIKNIKNAEKLNVEFFNK
jgi:hypothetical protein